MGFLDTPFATQVLDRFPKKDYKGVPLPEEELPMFCYPTGCKLFRARYQDAPLPENYGFIVKNERGDSIHGEFVLFGIVSIYFLFCFRITDISFIGVGYPSIVRVVYGTSRTFQIGSTE